MFEKLESNPWFSCWFKYCTFTFFVYTDAHFTFSLYMHAIYCVHYCTVFIAFMNML